MEPPEGLIIDKNKVLRLRRILYGLKQSPYEWYSYIDYKLITLGFRRSTVDLNLYVATYCQCILLLYVDDILLFGLLSDVITIKQSLLKLYNMKDLGLASLYLGM